MTRGCNIPDCPDEHVALGLCRRAGELTVIEGAA